MIWAAGAVALWGASATGSEHAASGPTASGPSDEAVATVRRWFDERRAYLDRYDVDGDIRTHLFLRCAEEPYTRATVACLLEAAARVRRGAIGRAAAGQTLSWCESALARALRGSDIEGFTPNPAPPSSLDSPGTPPGIGWLLTGACRDRDETLRRLDLVACLGGRLALDARQLEGVSPELLRVRASSVGLSYVRLGHTDEAPAPLRPVTPADALSLSTLPLESRAFWRPSPVRGPDFVAQTWIGRLLTRMTGRPVVLGPICLPSVPHEEAALARWRAEILLHALSGSHVFLARLPGPSDEQPAPWVVEATAHAGLDLVRLGEVIRLFPGATDIAVLAATRPGDEAASAAAVGGLGTIVGALADAQVPADPVGPAVLRSPDRMAAYKVLVLCGVERLPTDLVESVRRFRDAGKVLVAVGRCLIDVPRTGPGGIGFDLEVPAPGNDRTVAQELATYLIELRDRGTILNDCVFAVPSDGEPLRGLRSETLRDANGRYVTYFVNAGDRLLRFRLRHGGRLLQGRAMDLLGGQVVSLTAEGMTLAPGQARILRMSIRPL